ncbi:hypothetical protein [Longirhabdus pacifica]|uniref:hypothetical protein n=1 Tax=Longirhabdus pacifica TaxID=2305227 RepID=UPI0010091549|nr:hypothetical protein [Longirhabdus pacifica]
MKKIVVGLVCLCMMLGFTLPAEAKTGYYTINKAEVTYNNQKVQLEARFIYFTDGSSQVRSGMNPDDYAADPGYDFSVSVQGYNASNNLVYSRFDDENYNRRYYWFDSDNHTRSIEYFKFTFTIFPNDGSGYPTTTKVLYLYNIDEVVEYVDSWPAN